MPNLSSILGGSAVPIGGNITVLDGPINPTYSGSEYLRSGTLKAYDSSYAAAVAAAPQLKAYGTLANSYGDLSVSATPVRVFYVGTNYVRLDTSTQAYYGSTLALCSAGGSVVSVPTNVIASGPNSTQKSGFGNGYLVLTGGANTAPIASSNGSSFAAVGGTFATFPNPTVIAYLGAFGWLSLSALAGSAGSRGYIANTNPTGTWTVDTGTNLSMTTAYSAATNGSVIVVTGNSASATAGKIATSTTLAGAYTDRTATCGITFAASDTITNCVYSGSKFVAVYNANKIITSTDGLTWSIVATPVDASTLFINGATAPTMTINCLTTDGAGKVVGALAQSTGTLARALILVSADHGVTWDVVQCARANGHGFSSGAIATVSYANSKFLMNYSGNGTAWTTNMNIIDVGSLATTPDYIGQQLSYAQGNYVRIK